MAQSPVTVSEIITAVRELTFDRFIIPAFSIKEKAGFTVSVTPPKKEIPDPPVDDDYGYLEVKSTTEPLLTKKYLFKDVKTLEELMDALIEDNIVVAYTPYFRGTEPTSALIKADKPLDTPFTAYRRFFFSDEEILETISWYYCRVLQLNDVEVTDSIVGKLKRPSEKHLAIWVAYQLVDKRRLYENAAGAISQSYTDGSDYMGSGIVMGPEVTSVQIGSVFSISENPTEGYFQEDFNRVGSDNTWGDRYSFWYKLLMYLRGLLEENFGDYSLRKNNVFMGSVELVRDLDFRSYYDSYPFTLSPLSRGILSKTP